jgi:Meiotically Up-regulated Gene 113 (MUG113) protein
VEEVKMSWKHPRVYVFECQGHYKIGITCNVESRLSGIQTSCPFPVHLLMTLQPTVKAAQLEKQLHQKYRGQRTGGEWFKLSVSQVVHLAQSYKSQVTPRYTELVGNMKPSWEDGDHRVHLIGWAEETTS